MREMQFSLWSVLDQPQSSPSHRPSLCPLSSSFIGRRLIPKRNLSAVRRDMRITRAVNSARGEKTRWGWRLKYRFRGQCSVSFTLLFVFSFLLRLRPACSFVLPWSHHYRSLSASHPSLTILFLELFRPFVLSWHRFIRSFVSFSHFISSRTDPFRFRLLAEVFAFWSLVE